MPLANSRIVRNPEVIPKRLQKKNTQVQSTSFWPYLLQQFKIGGTDGIRTRNLLRDREGLDLELCKLLKKLGDVGGDATPRPPFQKTKNSSQKPTPYFFLKSFQQKTG